MVVDYAVSEAFGGPAPWGAAPPPIWESLSQSASLFPDRLAVASLHQDSSLYNINTNHVSTKYLRWSYADLSLAVDYFVESLKRHGVHRNHTVATFLYNGVEFVIAFWAAHKLGCTFVPINPRTLLNGVEASHMLKVSNASILIVQDQDLAHRVDTLTEAVKNINLKMLASHTGGLPSWLSLTDLIKPASNSPTTISPPQGEAQQENQIVTILFTSGTTSLPKGCPHTDKSLNAFFLNLSLGGQSESDIFCSVLPNNHAMGYFYCLYFFCHGGAVVYPSPSFEAPAMLGALELEKCTHTCLVPTALHALLDIRRAKAESFKSSLVDVCLAGASVTPEHMRQVINELGSHGVSTGFGMTEGSPIWTAYKRDPADLIRGDLTVVGTASPGARVRICAPDSQTAVVRGEKGEIHQCGPGVISKYLGDEGKENFYQDEQGQPWFCSGDQAVMYADGLVSITGRYKDMIIRGGENISPASIEAVLHKFEGVQAQVVGASDSIAGEIPIAVVYGASINTELVKSLQAAVLQAMGPAFVPDQFIPLAALGLGDFPKTTSGKVQKAELTQLVRAYRQQQEIAGDKLISDEHIQEAVVRAWFKATGIAAEHMDLNAPYTAFADSIAVMRVRDSLRKELGLSISAEDVVDHPSIRSQVDYIQRNVVHVAPTQQTPTQEQKPPSLEEMILMFGSEAEAIRMKQLMVETVSSKGFSWSEDVAAVIPAIDYMSVLVESELINTWNFAIAIMADESNTKQLTTAIEKTLTNNTILTSMYVLDHERNAHYVALKPSPKLWKMCIIDYGSVKQPEDVQMLAMQYPYKDHATVPGPLFRCLVIHVEQTNSAAMVMYVHHIVQDASFTRLVYEDLEEALSKPNATLRPHTDFKSWADSYKALRCSPAATLAVNYHVQRLRDLHLHKQALYPTAKLPRQAIQETPDGLDFGFDAPGLANLKKSHPDVIAAVVLKAAMALVNVDRTGYTHAAFNNFEAGRGPYPFQPESVRALDPDAFEAADVGGPTMEGVCNLVEVPRTETALSLLKRMQQDQIELTKHCHAPLRRIITDLNADGNGSGDMMVEVHKSHFLTWIPGFLGDYERIRVAQIAIRCTAGLVVVAGLGGPTATTYMFSMRWETANYSRAQTAAFVEDLKRAILWLTEEENWTKPVSVFLEQLKVLQQGKDNVMVEAVEVEENLSVESH